MRKNRIAIRVSDEELEIIKNRQVSLKFRSISQYIRKISIDTLIINIDTDGLNDLTNQISKIGNNVNQIARQINTDDKYSSSQLDNIIKSQKEIIKIIDNYYNQISKIRKV